MVFPGKFIRHSYPALLLPPLHIGLLFLAYHLLVLVFGMHQMNIFQFKSWDANWYANIAEQGYVFSAQAQSNVAFFPLFPFLWRALWSLTGAGVEGVCLLNACFFFAGLFLLKHAFRFSWLYLLFFASIPSNMFMFVPYTEALYFLFCSVFLTGLQRDDTRLKLVGLFLASLTRPTAYFFFPALLFMEFLCSESFRMALRRTAILTLAPLTALIIVICIQYADTGVWFAYFRDGWHRQISFPQFPLTTWGGALTLWLDGAAFFFCLLSFAALAALVVRRVRKIKTKPERTVVFSLVYVVLPGLSALLLGSFDVAGGTTLASLNRYVMATPFFVVTLFYLTHKVTISYKSWGMLILVLTLTYLMINFSGTGFAEYQEVHRLLYPPYMFCLIAIYFLASKRFGEKFLPMGYLINLFITVILLSRFSQGIWVG